MDIGVAKLLIDGGQVSVSLVTIWVLYKIVSNHMNHTTDAMIELNKTLSALKQLIKDKLDK